MLSKYKEVRCLDPEKGINRHFENVLCQGRIQIFFWEGVSEFDLFKGIFSAELI